MEVEYPMSDVAFQNRKFSMSHAPSRPRLAIVLGDPSGIGPEIAVRALSELKLWERADITLVGGRRELDAAIDIAANAGAVVDPGALQHLLFVEHGEDLPIIPRGEPSAAAGRYALASLSAAIELAQRNKVDGLCFAPLNKTSLHLAGMTQPDELRWFAEKLGVTNPVSELNALETLWTVRVTSHVPHKDVAGLLTQEGVADAVGVLYDSLRRVGFEKPRIAVAGLNPHAGENGNFGSEEIDIIAPGIALAKARGLTAEGPYPADTVFVRAKNGAFDGVVTMYHDQGQIAIKLLGFDRGVTVAGGLPISITTPAHGTAYDIVGQGRANTGAMRRALDVACLLSNEAQHPTAAN
jgi:4-hydroxythreonine-4-phosphate dehydrogenase